MEKYLIVGGGFSGLLAANLLLKKGAEFVGLEKSEKLGGRVESGHHRFYEEGSTDFLSKHFSDLEWEQISEPAKERRKGEWNDLNPDTLADEEAFYIGPRFYQTKGNVEKLLEVLSTRV